MKHVAVMPPHTEERAEAGVGFRLIRVIFRCSLVLTVGVVLLLGCGPSLPWWPGRFLPEGFWSW